jgi:hypothetical protein
MCKLCRITHKIISPILYSLLGKLVLQYVIKVIAIFVLFQIWKKVPVTRFTDMKTEKKSSSVSGCNQ